MNRLYKEYRKAIYKIIAILANVGLYLDVEKSEFKAPIITYLGYIVNARKAISIDLKKIKVIA